MKALLLSAVEICELQDKKVQLEVEVKELQKDRQLLDDFQSVSNVLAITNGLEVTDVRVEIQRVIDNPLEFT